MQNKIKYYQQLFKIYRNYKKHKIEVSTLPLRLWTELDSRCNLKCVMCPNKELAASQQGSMSWEVFKKVIDEASEFVYDMALHHRGESMLHPDAVKMISYAASKINITKLHTNGTLLNPELNEGLVNSGLKRISFSFDGFDQENYEKIRVGAQFHQVVANIKSLLQIRNEHKKIYPLVAIEVIQLSKSQLDANKKEQFINEFKKLGLNEIIIKKPHNWAGLINLKYSKKNYAPCTFLWNALLVLWNGDVVPCAQDFFARNIVGNINEKSLKEIWNDQPIKDLRLALVKQQPQNYPVCENCDRLWRDTFLGIPKEYLRQILFKKMP